LPVRPRDPLFLRAQGPFFSFFLRITCNGCDDCRSLFSVFFPQRKFPFRRRAGLLTFWLFPFFSFLETASIFFSRVSSSSPRRFADRIRVETPPFPSPLPASADACQKSSGPPLLLRFTPPRQMRGSLLFFLSLVLAFFLLGPCPLSQGQTLIFFSPFSLPYPRRLFLSISHEPFSRVWLSPSLFRLFSTAFRTELLPPFKYVVLSSIS